MVKCVDTSIKRRIEMDHKNYDALNLENQLCFPLYAASREIIKLYRPYLDELNLTYTQFITMMVLWQEKKVNAKDLGRRLFLDSGTLTPVLKSLEGKGWLSRCRSAEDERMLLVELTNDGAALRERAMNIPDRVRSCLKLTAEEIRQLHKLLYKLLNLSN